MKLWMILLIILAVLVAILVVLYFLGRKAQKKQEEQRAQLEAAKQTYTMLIIDKKIMPLRDAGLPAAVLEQTPKRYRKSKVPVVKAKVGPKIMTLLAEESVFSEIPVKKEVKAEVSGMYIMGVKGLHGRLEAPPEKLSRWQRFKRKVSMKAQGK